MGSETSNAFSIGWSMGYNTANAMRAGDGINSDQVLSLAANLGILDIATKQDFLFGYQEGLDSYRECVSNAQSWHSMGLLEANPNKSLALRRLAKSLDQLCILPIGMLTDHLKFLLAQRHFAEMTQQNKPTE